MASTRHLSFKPDNHLPKVVIVIPKKVARLAVQRNKLRRRIREIIRCNLSPTPLGTLYTRKGVAELSFTELKAEILTLFQ